MRFILGAIFALLLVIIGEPLYLDYEVSKVRSAIEQSYAQAIAECDDWKTPRSLCVISYKRGVREGLNSRPELLARVEAEILPRLQ